MRIVIIGSNGNIARTYKKVFESLGVENAEIVACIDTVPEDILGWNVPIFPSWELLISSGISFDAAEVITPPDSHEEYVRAALMAGYDVLVEKPAAPSSRVSADLISLAKAQERVLFFCYHTQYAAGIEDLTRELAGKPIKHFSIVYIEDVHDYRAPGTTDFAPGAVWDSAINALSALAKVAPQLDSMTLASSRTYHSERAGVTTAAYAEFELEGVPAGTLQQHWMLPGNTVRVIEIDTGKDLYHLDIHHQFLRKNGAIIVHGEVEGAYIREYRGQQTHFLQSLAERTSYTPLQPIFLVEAIERAA